MTPRNLWGWVVVAWCLVALAAPWLQEPGNHIDLTRMFARPGPVLWLGADELGRSIALRVLAGAGVSAPLALGVVLASAFFGTSLGVLAGWLGGTLDHLILRLIEVFQAVPGMLLAIALAGVLGPGAFNVALALALTGWVGFARLARAQTTSLKHRAHVEAAHAMGVREPSILVRHVMPFLAGPLLVEATFAFAATIAAEAGLSFLGLGAQPPVATWGGMLREATHFLLVAPHMLLGPALALLSLVLAMQVGGERLRRRWQVGR
jgi:peptide/nickel transport system permease protein